MALTKSERSKLDDDSFAVPGKRKLPIQDEKHVRMAWDMASRTEGLTDAERAEARRRILERAAELGMDTSDWNKFKAMSISAVALALVMPNDGEHPNKMPFSGVMTKIGQASNEPPHGSGGRRVLLTPEAADKALPSLLGMAVDLTAKLDGHDPQSKIGIITSATVEGDDLCIEGYIYAADFPNEAARIRADKDVLGFSFEAMNVLVADPGADPLEIIDCVFTGAAILRKDKAAYRMTSLKASADQEIEMTHEEMKALLDGAVKPLVDANSAITARLEKIESASSESLKKLEASKAVMDAVEPHAVALENCAAGMEGAGIGCAAERGHTTMLRKMAKSMRAAAALGKMPDVYRDHDYSVYATAERFKPDTSEIDEAVKKAVAPLQAVSDAAAKKLAEAESKLADVGTKLADAEAKVLKASADPGRKTVPPAISALLAKSGLAAPDGDEKLPVGKVDEALGKAGLTMSQRIQAKTALTHAGML